MRVQPSRRPLHPHPNPLPKGEGEKLIAKFFDFLEANADMYWDVPQWQPSDRAGANLLAEMSDSADDEEAELTGERDDDDDDLFSAAYENMVYRDSTADDIDADMLEGPSIGGDSGDELEGEQRRLFSRLAFLGTLAALWKQVGVASSAAWWNTLRKAKAAVATVDSNSKCPKVGPIAPRKIVKACWLWPLPFSDIQSRSHRPVTRPRSNTIAAGCFVKRCWKKSSARSPPRPMQNCF